MPTFTDACEAVLRDPGGDHSLYTTLAPLYERMTTDDDARYAAQLRTVEAYVPQSARTVLEVGCGVGRLLPDLAERHGVATGLDASQELLSVAADRVAARDGIDLVRADVAEPGLDLDRSFDAAVSLEYLTAHLHGESFERALGNVRGHLHDGGTLVCDAVRDARVVAAAPATYESERYALERSVEGAEAVEVTGTERGEGEAETVEVTGTERGEGEGDLVVVAEYRVTDRTTDETATASERIPVRTFEADGLARAVEDAGFRSVEVGAAPEGVGALVVSARA